jgi:uncharacterized integral membrane protein
MPVRLVGVAATGHGDWRYLYDVIGLVHLQAAKGDHGRSLRIPRRPMDARSVAASAAVAIASIVGLAVLLIVIIQNTETIRFTLHFVHFSWPLWVYTIAAAVFGTLVWFGLGVIRRHRRRVQRRRDRS